MAMGSGLVSAGGGVLYMLCLVGMEAMLRNEHPNPILILVVAGLYTLGVSMIGFFVKNLPFWYFILTGILPGFLLVFGWRYVRVEFEKSHTIWSRSIVIMLPVIGMILASGIIVSGIMDDLHHAR